MSTTTENDQEDNTMELESSEVMENQENEDQNGEVEEVPKEEEEKEPEDDNNPQVSENQDDKKAHMKKLTLAANKAKATKNISLIGRVPKSCRTFNMELAKALGILGFTNMRWMETCKKSGITPKQVLDQAHFSKTMMINKQRVSFLLWIFQPKLWFWFQMKAEEEMENNEGKVQNFGTLKKMSFDDQVRQVHEAYQFLIKKYKLQESVASTALMIQTLEREKREAKAVALQNQKDEEKKAENNKKVALESDADEPKLKRKPSSSLKRTKKTSKNAAASSD